MTTIGKTDLPPHNPSIERLRAETFLWQLLEEQIARLAAGEQKWALSATLDLVTSSPTVRPSCRGIKVLSLARAQRWRRLIEN